VRRVRRRIAKLRKLPGAHIDSGNEPKEFLAHVEPTLRFFRVRSQRNYFVKSARGFAVRWRVGRNRVEVATSLPQLPIFLCMTHLRIVV
jgi:hypothetical protein